jgi:cysteinyl-tRNA synthetase
VHEREAARRAKDWKQSDALRDQIVTLGWIVKDTKDGPMLSPK